MESPLHSLSIASVVLASLALSAPSQADEACMTSYVQAQKLRAASKLIESREELKTCAQASCPDALVTDCSTWLSEVEQAIPRLSVAAVDEDGNETLDVAVSVNGVTRLNRLSTTPLALNPGEHTIVFSRGGNTISKKVIAQQGMRRTLNINFSDGGDASGSTGSLPIAGMTVGLVGIAGLTVAAIVGIPYIQSLNDHNDLVTAYDVCIASGTSSCTLPEEFNTTPGTVADIAGIAGGAALAVGVGLTIHHYLSSPSPAEPNASRRKPLKPSPFVGVAPIEGGAFGTVGVHF